MPGKLYYYPPTASEYFFYVLIAAYCALFYLAPALFLALIDAEGILTAATFCDYYEAAYSLGWLEEFLLTPLLPDPFTNLLLLAIY